jgi:PAS domain S-box-containing protein
MRVSIPGSESTIVTFPADDAVFAARIRATLADLDVRGLDAILDRLKHDLCPVHPRVELHVRTSLAGFGPGLVVYAFRDGSALDRHRDGTWCQDPALARLVTDGDGTYLDANAAAAELFGVKREDIIGKSAGAFTRPDAVVPDGDALWRTLKEQGQLHSLAIVQRPDGVERHVEFVTTRDQDGPGRHVTVIRGLDAG